MNYYDDNYGHWEDMDDPAWPTSRSGPSAGGRTEASDENDRAGVS